ncbi:MAG: replicative DNA helicase [Muribaculaceae bacterium]|nr:replicative DNA helicase [Muribaculaceae bacterium]
MANENNRNYRSNGPRNPFAAMGTPSDAVGRLVPRAVEVEAAVLGALMLEKDAFPAVCEIISPDSFYDPRHKLIYEAILSLGVNQEPIDMISVTERLRHNDTLDKAGGVAYVVGLTANVASGAHVEYHARIVAQKYLARELISFASTIENSAFDETNDVDDLLQEAEKYLFEISQRNVKREVTQIDPLLNRALEQIQIAGNRESGLSGLSSGFTEIDRITSGWQNSDLIIIAARPAMGKTAFVLSMALNIALDNNPVAVFSLEMSDLQLTNRLISNVCEMPGEKIKSGQISTLEWQQILHRIERLKGAPIYVDDTSGLSVMELRTKARRLVREHDVKMIVIDYLQLMNASGMGMQSREQEVSTISRSLKQLAKELNIPIVALSQLNRKVEDRGNKDKRPQLSDLRESGAIEQDADIVCFIHRPEYYAHSGEDAQGRDIRGLAEFIFAKHRSGSVGTVDLRFRKEFVRFENWNADTGTYGTMSASDNPGVESTAVPADSRKAAADIGALLGVGAPHTDAPF